MAANTAPTIDPEVIKKWKSELSNVQENEEINIVSGELNCDLYSKISGDLKTIIQNKNVKVNIIGGPIISIDENGTNAALELVKEKLINLWISPTRQLLHFRTYAIRLGYREDYHQALDEKRTGKYIYEPFEIYKLKRLFQNLINLHFAL